MTSVDNIVVSGVAGRFPECKNVDEFKEALFEGVDLLTENDKRYPAGIFGVPKRQGAVPDIDKFDASFFGIHSMQSNATDARHRILLETVYECIVDAGYNPSELRGTKTGVYISIPLPSCLEEHRNRDSKGYFNIGLCTASSANRISYCFDFKGPSIALDTACSSTISALALAVRDLKLGAIDRAIVGGAHINFHPKETKGFLDLNMLSPEGYSKVFSKERNGYVRSEAIGSYLLQRESQSRRVYAKILGSGISADGYKVEGMTYPSKLDQVALLKEVYGEANVDPNDVSYVEAHGTGTPAGDIEECGAISEIFCSTRSTPLPIGSVKSNMGHAETAAGVPSLTKVIIAMEEGVIPANLYTENLDMTLPGISHNKLQVVSANLPWKGGIVGLNSFGFGGANAHVTLKSYDKEKVRDNKRPKNRLVIASGRTQEAVSHFLKGIEDGQDDDEFLALVDEIHKSDIEGHPFRGYKILGERPVDTIKRCNTKNRPIWFIYSGMGSQWTGMGKDLLNIKLFRDTFMRCADALKPYGIDLVDVVTDTSKNIADNIVHSFVAITSIQVALTDLLNALGITPDGIAGHSLGEIASGYADRTITPEQAVLLAYSRGLATTTTPLPPGLMAAVGLSKEEMTKLLPDDVVIACQNGKSSVTISGPETSIKTLVEKLTAQGIFARLVNTGGFAFHSEYVADAGPSLLDFCEKLLKDPKPRSDKWVSTSVPESQRHETWTRVNGARYNYNNYMNPVLFDEVYKHIPDNALVLEVAPHGLLQAILKREIGQEAVNVSLTSRTADDNEQFLLAAIGKIFVEGEQPNLRHLYSGVSFPVSRGTKRLSSLVKWDHSISWFTGLWKHADSFGEIVSINVSSEEYSHLKGHFIDGRVLMPATGYLELVWRVMAKHCLKPIENLPVVMENIRFQRATVLPDGEDIQFLINIMKHSGYFEIFEGGSVVVSGYIRLSKDISEEFLKFEPQLGEQKGYPLLSRHDLYKEFHLRRYTYRGQFQGITECDVDGLRAKIQWTGKFTSFMDTMLHPLIIANHRRDLRLPTSIEQLVIDPVTHLDAVRDSEELAVMQNQYCNVIRAGGIEISGLKTTIAPRRQKTQADPYLETYDFVHYDSRSNASFNFDKSLTIALQIVLQNYPGQKQLKICEVGHHSQLKAALANVLDKQPFCRHEYLEKTAKSFSDGTVYDIVVLDGKKSLEMDVKAISDSLSPAGFILHLGEVAKPFHDYLHVVFGGGSGTDRILLLRPKIEPPKHTDQLEITSSGFKWLAKLKELSQRNQEQVVYLYNERGDTSSGIVGLTKCLVMEPSRISWRCVFIDQEAKRFSLDDAFYRTQLQKNLTLNVLRGNEWGTFVFLPLEDVVKREEKNASVSIETIGDLSTIQWVQEPYPLPPPRSKKQELIHVCYSALNFKDVMIASGKLQLNKVPHRTSASTPDIGFEYSGVTASGRRVMGMTTKCIALQLHSHPSLTWDVPDSWSLQDAATVPAVYGTCYYAMMMRGQMRKGESILIHAGTGGVGLAAISIALSMDAKIFTTVSTREKKEFLKKMFPSLEDGNIGYSRDKSFQNWIMNETQGNGVDLILNSLAADLFQASLRCIAEHGRFLEIGKVDFFNGTLIDSSVFLRACSFHGINLDDLFEGHRPESDQLHSLMSDGIRRGVVKPLPSVVFKEDEVESAFRFLASGKHKGKVLIQIRDASRLAKAITATPRVYFDQKKSYILVGGLGGFGLELVDWMIRKGATKIILNSRRNVLNGYQGLCLRKWSLWGNVVVKVNTDDTSDLEGAKRLVLEAEKLGPVGGVFNLALVLKDGLITNQTQTNFEEVFKCKIVSCTNMDIATRLHCTLLDYFVVFSSLACGRGNSGQSNYGMANSAMEMLCEKRRRDNLPALAVQWGPIGDVGFLAKNGREDEVVLGLLPQQISSCLSVFEKFLLQSHTIVSSFVLADDDKTTCSTATRTPADAVAHILGVKDINLIDKFSTLSQLGIDSLMVAEIKQTLYRNFQLELDIPAIRQLTFEHLMSLGGKETNTLGHKTLQDTPNFMLSQEAIVKMKAGLNKDKTIFFIHPIEGRLDSLKPLAEKMNVTVYGIQCTKNTDHDTIEDFASSYIEMMKAKQPKGPYVLMGYSFGAVVSLEIAIQLGRIGEEVCVIALDGSPVILKNMAKMIHDTQGQSKSEAIKKFCDAFIKVSPIQFDNILDATTKWDEKSNKKIASGTVSTDLDLDDFTLSALCYYKRSCAGYKYEPHGKINGKVILIRSLNVNPHTSSDDYDLQKICQQKVDVIKVKGDHYTMLADENVSAISDIINNKEFK